MWSVQPLTISTEREWCCCYIFTNWIIQYNRSILCPATRVVKSLSLETFLPYRESYCQSHSFHKPTTERRIMGRIGDRQESITSLLCMSNACFCVTFSSLFVCRESKSLNCSKRCKHKILPLHNCKSCKNYQLVMENFHTKWIRL